MSVREASSRADLHTHSTASDGADAPAELVRKAVQRGLAVFALTDHDTTAGLAEADAAGDAEGLRVVHGIELSTDVPRGELHLLGYGIDLDNDELQQTLAALREQSARRLLRILERLRELGIDLPDSVVERDDETRSVGRPHVARALVAAGHAASVQDAFDRYLGNGRPAYVRKARLAPVDAVRLVRRAGGLAALAHPFSLPAFRDHVPQLVSVGLAGLEVFYGEYDDARRRELAALAALNALLMTGGSDYHGENFKVGRELGAADIPPAVLARFLDALDAR